MEPHSYPLVSQPDPTTFWIGLAAVFLLTLLTGGFAMAETALHLVRPVRVEQMMDEGRRGAVAIRRLAERPEPFIAATQVAIALLTFAAAAISALTLAPLLVPPLSALTGGETSTTHTLAIAITLFLVALLNIVLGEIAPKSIARHAPDRWALRLAPFILVCTTLLTPMTAFAVWISSLLVRPFGITARFEAPFVTREEFEKMIDQGEKHGELDDDEAKIITRVFDLSETLIRSVLTPRIDMTALDVEASLEQLLDTILDSGHSRIPIYENTVDNIIGIVHAKDLLPLLRASETQAHEMSPRTVMRPPLFVPETRRVGDLLEEMRRSQQQFAIVQDEYAGTAGLVTIEDLLEEIVGDIKDEYDVDEPDVKVLSATESLIDGRMSIDDVNDRLGLELPHEEYDTIGGLVFGLLGHEPAPGEQVEWGGLTFRVETIEGRRIKSLRAIRQPDATDPPEDGTPRETKTGEADSKA